MEFDYFYGQQAEQFSFYRIPKMLFTDDRFWNVSTDAKLLYGILLDRMNLSARNGWMDTAGRVYIIFTLEETMAALNCGDNKATKLYNELEKKCGLIERKRQGLGKPNLIYVKNFVSGVDSIVESRFKSRENHDSGVGQTPIVESGKPRGNNTDTNYTDYSDTDPFLSSGFCGKGTEGNGEWKQYYDYFREQLEFDILLSRYPYDHNLLNSILDLIVETVCTRRKLIRIASDDKPAEIVKSRFMKLESDHICFVIDCFKENKTDVRNVKQYLLAAIYNAPLIGRKAATALRLIESVTGRLKHKPSPSQKWQNCSVFQEKRSTGFSTVKNTETVSLSSAWPTGGALPKQVLKYGSTANLHIDFKSRSWKRMKSHRWN